jgi:hypothetical protein
MMGILRQVYVTVYRPTCVIVSFRSPSLCYLLVHSRCKSFFYFHLITLKHTPLWVGLPWTSDRPVAETSTWQYKHYTRDKHPCFRWDSNPRSQQALGRLISRGHWDRLVLPSGRKIKVWDLFVGLVTLRKCLSQTNKLKIPRIDGALYTSYCKLLLYAEVKYEVYMGYCSRMFDLLEYIVYEMVQYLKCATD